MGALTVTESCAVYWNYGLHHLAEGEQIPAGEFAAYLLATGAPVQDVEPVGDVDGDGVPDGSVKEVLAWVDADPARAQAAIEAENARPKPRPSLVAELSKLTTPPPAPQVPAEEPEVQE